MTLMAAFLPMMGCVAEYTEPMPPSATLPLMTYSPTCVPSARSVPVASGAPSPIISIYHEAVEAMNSQAGYPCRLNEYGHWRGRGGLIEGGAESADPAGAGDGSLGAGRPARPLSADARRAYDRARGAGGL